MKINIQYLYQNKTNCISLHTENFFLFQKNPLNSDKCVAENKQKKKKVVKPLPNAFAYDTRVI